MGNPILAQLVEAQVQDWRYMRLWVIFCTKWCINKLSALFQLWRLIINFYIVKTCSARILQWINDLKEWCNNHWGRAKVTSTSFTRFGIFIHSSNLHSNSCLSCLDNGFCCWEVIYLECQNAMHLTSKQKFYQSKSLKYVSLKYQSILYMPLLKIS